MSAKPKQEVKVPVLKGQEAEDKILEYLRAMNRPYGAVDVSANLKGAVPKTATQKILVALAEKGELIQKVYGKTTFFVYNQDKIEAFPSEKIALLKTEHSRLETENQVLSAEVKSCIAELAKIKALLTNEEIHSQIASIEEAIAQTQSTLTPLRAGAPPISAEDLDNIYAEWKKWRTEWVRRRKVFVTLWQLTIDALTPQDAKALEEDLGIERDSQEHGSLERGALCLPGVGFGTGRSGEGNPLKRKRV